MSVTPFCTTVETWTDGWVDEDWADEEFLWDDGAIMTEEQRVGFRSPFRVRVVPRLYTNLSLRLTAASMVAMILPAFSSCDCMAGCESRFVDTIQLVDHECRRM
jgi:hypothetical protein